MKNIGFFAFWIFLIIFLASCSTTGATYFRKSNAAREDERRDWGLCGGGFNSDGSLTPEIEGDVMNCMRRQGYETMNDFYVEEHVDFYDPRNPQNPNSPSLDAKKACGMERLEDGICGIYGFVWRSRLVPFVNCMAAKGYQPSLPRTSIDSVRVLEDGTPFNPSFCLTLTRRMN